MEEYWQTTEEKLIMWCEEENDVYDRLQYIKERIKWEAVTENVLEQWAMLLKASICVDENNTDIGEEASSILKDILTQEYNCYFRLSNGVACFSNDEDTNEYRHIYEKWQKLRSYYCGAFPDFLFSLNLSQNVSEYCHKIGIVEADMEDTDNSQESRAKAEFSLKYSKYIDDLDTFFVSLNTIKGKELKAIFNRKFAKSDVTLKDFFEACEKIVPERKGERGWNYEAVKKY